MTDPQTPENPGALSPTGPGFIIDPHPGDPEGTPEVAVPGALSPTGPGFIIDPNPGDPFPLEPEIDQTTPLTHEERLALTKLTHAIALLPVMDLGGARAVTPGNPFEGVGPSPEFLATTIPAAVVTGEEAARLIAAIHDSISRGSIATGRRVLHEIAGVVPRLLGILGLGGGA